VEFFALKETLTMVALFSNFTTTLVVVGVILALGIIFEKQLISLEDKFDAWWADYKANLKSRKGD
jgi:hypothetical protein